MAQRPLPSSREAADILAHKRTRPGPRSLPPAGRSLGKLLKDLDARFGQGPGALQARWREIVGPEIGRRTEPVRLIRSRTGEAATLELRVAGAAALLIQHQTAEIMARVNLFLGDGAVGKLRIVQGPLQLTRPERPSPIRRRAPPLDAAVEAQLAQAMGLAADGPLKAALLELGRAVMRQRSNR